MASLDEISFKLGELSNAVGTLARQSEERSRVIEDIKTNVGEIKTRMKPLTDEVAKMKPHVAHYAGVRRFGAVILTGLVSIAAGAGSFLTHYVEKKWFS